METIREYLNNLFMSLPETPEVLRAKAELLEMMEDKYEELLSEGKSEKEAVGTVLSEFGNLEELAEELGIDRYMKQGTETGSEGNGKDTAARTGRNKDKTVYQWGFDEAKAYINYAWKHAVFIAVGVMFCIWSPYLDSILDGAVAEGYIPDFVSDVVGSATLFILVAAAVGLFCGASGIKKKYGKLSRYCISLDEKAAAFIEQKRERDEGRRLGMRIAGVTLCILSVVPSSVNYFENYFLSEAMDCSVLIIVGIGVLLLVLSSSVGNRYDELEKAVKNAGDVPGNRSFPTATYKEGTKKGMPSMLILVFILLGIIIVFGNIWGIVAHHMDSSSSGVQMQTTEQAYDINDVTKLLLDVDAGELRVETSDNPAAAMNQVVVKYEGDSRRSPVVEKENGALQVKEKKKFHWFNFDMNFWKGEKKRTITVIVPPGRNNLDYEMNVDAGTLNMVNVIANQVTANIDAGSIAVNDCQLYKLVSDVDAGNLEIRNSVIERAEGNVDMGNVTCYISDGPLTRYAMQLEVDMGQITVNGKKSGTTYNQPAQGDGPYSELEFDVDMGDISVEAPVTQ